MFIETLFIMTPNWKQPRSLSIPERIKKLWYIHILEYLPVIKRNELSKHKKTRMNLKCTGLREISPLKKATFNMIRIM